MNLRLLHLLLFLGHLLVPALALAGVDQLSEKEFRALAEELAPKVNLFHDTWKQDPKAEFYGGTTRDYLYWVKGKFKDAHTPAEAHQVAAKLRAQAVIDVRSFIIGDSDVDIVSQGKAALDPTNYGVRKIDSLSADIFQPGTDLHHNEINQGFIPAEKVRLGKNGFGAPAALGDGIKEIYSGNLSIHFADEAAFNSTKYAKEGVNHPVLLALRYLRLAAIDYFQTYGEGVPDKSKLFRMSPEIKANLHKYIDQAMNDKNFPAMLEKKRFVSWLNGSIQKAFRSYTNPTAALELMKEFGVDKLPALYPKYVEPVNQYVFAKFRDAKKIAENLKKYDVKQKQFFISPRGEFSDGYLYHGTKTEEAFRSINFQGVLGSETGLAGEGLYGVSVENKAFSEEWGGDRNRLIRLPVKDEAKIVDIRSGEGEKIWNEFNQSGKKKFEAFADAFGIDILKYPYKPDAYVVKNSDALGRAEGVYRQILPIGEILARAKGETNPRKILAMVEVNNLSKEELNRVWDTANVKPESFLPLINGAPADTALVGTYALGSTKYQGRRDLAEAVVNTLKEKIDPKVAGGIIQPYLAAYPDLVDRLAERPAGDLNDPLAQNVVERLTPANRLKILEKWADQNTIPPGVASKILPNYEPGYEKIAMAMIAHGQASEFLGHGALHRQGWGNHPEIVEALIARKEKEIDEYVVYLFRTKNNKNWYTNTNLIYKLASNGNVYFDLFMHILSQPEFSDQPELVERCLRLFFRTPTTNRHSVENGLIGTRNSQWKNNRKLLSLTRGQTVNLDNLEKAFRQGRSLLTPAQLAEDAKNFPAISVTQRCAQFFRRFVK